MQGAEEDGDGSLLRVNDRAGNPNVTPQTARYYEPTKNESNF